MNLIQAWSYWLSGNELPEETVICFAACWNILFWARLGKFLQLVSAIAIIFDIIGPEKIRKAGNSLHQFSFKKSAGKYLEITMGWIEWLKTIFTNSIDHENQSTPYQRIETESLMFYFNRVIFKNDSLDKMNLFLSSLMSVFLVRLLIDYFEHHTSGFDKLFPYSDPLDKIISHTSIFLLLLLFALLGWWFIFLVISPMSISGLYALLFFGYFICEIFLKTVAWMLERKYVDNWIKVISFVVFLIGFHFEFLGS